jgi:hypothetical protein
MTTASPEQSSKREMMRRILIFDLLLRTGIPALLLIILSFTINNDPLKPGGDWLAMFMIVLITGTFLSLVAGLLRLLMIVLKKSA